MKKTAQEKLKMIEMFENGTPVSSILELFCVKLNYFKRVIYPRKIETKGKKIQRLFLDGLTSREIRLKTGYTIKQIKNAKYDLKRNKIFIIKKISK